MKEFKIFKKVYNLAWEYLEGLSGPSTGIYPNIFDANQLTLSYFRSDAYDADHFDLDSKNGVIESLKGLAWRTIAGTRDESFVKMVELQGIKKTEDLYEFANSLYITHSP